VRLNPESANVPLPETEPCTCTIACVPEGITEGQHCKERASCEATELALQAEAEEAAPETCDPVVEEVDFDDLDDSKKIETLRNVLGEVLQANAGLEQRVQNVEGILYRILQAAEKAEVKSRIEVPAMATSIKRRR